MALMKEGGQMPDGILIIHPRDNVGVALKKLFGGEKVKTKNTEEFQVLEDIPESHKVALRDIAEGEEIIKYGEKIAVSSRKIKRGQWVHTQNLESERWRK